jgi:LPS-assembly lipoprotein
MMFKPALLRSVSAVLMLCLVTVLTACGFHLRNQSSLPSILQPIYIGGKFGNGTLAGALRYQLTNSDTKTTPYVGAANYRLMLLNESHEQRIISLDKRGLAAEYGLISVIEFELLDHSGQRVLGPLKLQELRTVTNNPDNPLTTSQEVVLVQTDIDKSLAALVVRRLGAFANHLPAPAPAAGMPATTEPSPSEPATSQPTPTPAP